MMQAHALQQLVLMVPPSSLMWLAVAECRRRVMGRVLRQVLGEPAVAVHEPPEDPRSVIVCFS